MYPLFVVVHLESMSYFRYCVWREAWWERYYIESKAQYNALCCIQCNDLLNKHRLDFHLFLYKPQNSSLML